MSTSTNLCFPLAPGWTLCWPSSLDCRSDWIMWIEDFTLPITACAMSLTLYLLFMSQVLKGDIRPAIETHEMLYQVTKKHNFLPEVICLSVYLSVYLTFNTTSKGLTALPCDKWHLSAGPSNPIWPVSPTTADWKGTSLPFMRHSCILASSICSNYTAWDGVLTPSSFSVFPQAFTTDFRVHWAQHPLRPEFAESTYFLYKVIYQASLA